MVCTTIDESNHLPLSLDGLDCYVDGNLNNLHSKIQLSLD